MTAGDKISIRGQVIEYAYFPTGIKWELVRCGVDCDKCKAKQESYRNWGIGNVQDIHEPTSSRF